LQSRDGAAQFEHIFKKLTVFTINQSESIRFRSSQLVPYISGSIVCISKVKNSIVEVIPNLIDLGECNVGDFKSKVITVTNCGSQPALLIPCFQSNTITLSRKQIYLEPGHSTKINVDYIAYVVDSVYSKAIEFVNLFNPSSRIMLEVRATNVDTRQILFHDIFYKLYTYSGSRQLILYYKNCVINRPNFRLLSLRNVYSEPLTICLKTGNTSEISLYWIRDVAVETDGSNVYRIKSMSKESIDIKNISIRRDMEPVLPARLKRAVSHGEESLPAIEPSGVYSEINQSDTMSFASNLNLLYSCSDNISGVVIDKIEQARSNPLKQHGGITHASEVEDRLSDTSRSVEKLNQANSVKASGLDGAAEFVVREFDDCYNYFSSVRLPFMLP
jgi:hypothetical protein